MSNKIAKSLIAPCGMDCGICRAFLRQRNPCHGCRDAEQNKPITIERCHMRICRERMSSFYCDCADFPCDRLRHLDLRYRTRYGMSEIENLEFIRDRGIRKFLEKERRKYISEKGVLCTHDGKYYDFPSHWTGPAKKKQKH
jgi:hypothetical protein